MKDNIGAVKYGGAKARNRSDEKIFLLLNAVLRWGAINQPITATILRVSTSCAYSTLKQMEERKLIQPVLAPNLPSEAYILTRFGVEQAHVMLDCKGLAAVKPIIHPSRVNVQNLPHDLLAAHVAVKAASGAVDRVTISSAREILGSGEPLASQKIPDAAFLSLDTGGKLALEIQQTYEPVETIERIFYRYLQHELNPGSNDLPKKKYDHISYYSTSQTLLDFYEEIYNGKIHEYYYSPREKKWVQVSGKIYYAGNYPDAPDVNFKLIPPKMARHCYYRSPGCKK